jgi:hypothetical protein
MGTERPPRGDRDPTPVPAPADEQRALRDIEREQMKRLLRDRPPERR